MRRGLAPKDAAARGLQADRRHEPQTPRLRDAKGRPNFEVKFYCVTKDGRFAGASLWAGARMAVHDGDAARLVDCTSLYDEPRPADC